MAKQPVAQPATPENVHEYIRSALAAPETMKMLLEAMKAVQQQEKAETKSADMEGLTVKAFKRAGYGEVTPRVDTKTYNLWVEAGRRVKPGEHAIKVKQLRLFHVSQTEEISKQEQAAILEKKAAKTDSGTASKLPQVTPFPAKGKAKAKPQPAQPSA